MSSISIFVEPDLVMATIWSGKLDQTNFIISFVNVEANKE